MSSDEDDDNGDEAANEHVRDVDAEMAILAQLPRRGINDISEATLRGLAVALAGQVRAALHDHKQSSFLHFRLRLMSYMLYWDDAFGSLEVGGIVGRVGSV